VLRRYSETFWNFFG